MKQLGFLRHSPAALAVSGGGDSIALMHLFAHWAKGGEPMPAVLIVDHGLRAQSRKEAAVAAEWARGAGLPAHVLTWRGAKPRSDVEGKAREARYRLLGAWCAGHGIANLFVAHTREDQAETFLLRLARGSGVDGLAAMAPRAPLPVAAFAGVSVLRPLLDIGRAELRAYLRGRGADWIEDPMNEDTQFARVRIRKLLPQLEAAGIGPERIADAAAHLARARLALEVATAAFLANHVRFERNEAASIDGVALQTLPRETALRAVSAVLMHVSGATYRPRFERLEKLLDAIRSGTLTARTLLGCRIGRAPKAKADFGPSTLIVTRENARKSAQKTGKEAANRRPPIGGRRTACRTAGGGLAP